MAQVPTGPQQPPGGCAIDTQISPVLLSSMALIPRWRYMTDEAKSLSKRVAVSAVVVLGALLLLRALLPWVILAVVLWWIWKGIARR